MRFFSKKKVPELDLPPPPRPSQKNADLPPLPPLPHEESSDTPSSLAADVSALQPDQEPSQTQEYQQDYANNESDFSTNDQNDSESQSDWPPQSQDWTYTQKKESFPPLETAQSSQTQDDFDYSVPIEDSPEMNTAEMESYPTIGKQPMPAQEELPDLKEKRFVDMGPLFVKSDDYKTIMENIQDVRKTLTDADAVLINLREIKTQKDKEFKKMHKSIEDIQRKLVYIDKTVFGG